MINGKNIDGVRTSNINDVEFKNYYNHSGSKSKGCDDEEDLRGKYYN